MKDVTIAENQTFSFPRFWQLMKSDMRLNRPKYLRIAAATVGCFLTAAILITIFAIREANMLLEHGQSIYGSQMQHAGYYYFSSFMIFCIGLTILGSLTFNSMSTKSGRISTLMMPASMFEKFLLRFVIYFIGGIILLIIGYLIGLAEIFITFPDKNAVFIVREIPFSDEEAKRIVMIMGTIVGLPILFSNAFYSLGSALWPRTSWIKTWVVQQILGVVFMFTGAFGAFSLITDFFRWLDALPIDGRSLFNGDALFGVYIGVFVVLIAGCWALAWWRFRTTQIVQLFMKK